MAGRAMAVLARAPAADASAWRRVNDIGYSPLDLFMVRLRKASRLANVVFLIDAADYTLGPRCRLARAPRSSSMPAARFAHASRVSLHCIMCGGRLRLSRHPCR